MIAWDLTVLNGRVLIDWSIDLFDLIWFDLIWFDLIWFDLIWFDWLIDWLIDRLIYLIWFDWLIDWLIDWLLDVAGHHQGSSNDTRCSSLSTFTANTWCSMKCELISAVLRYHMCWLITWQNLFCHCYYIRSLYFCLCWFVCRQVYSTSSGWHFWKGSSVRF